METDQHSQNRGIGKAICQNILSRPDLPSLKLFATSRKGENLGLSGKDRNEEIIYPKLDISSFDSINAFRDEVRRHGDANVLINNAGINLDAKYSPETVKQTIDVNYRGTVNVCGKCNGGRREKTDPPSRCAKASCLTCQILDGSSTWLRWLHLSKYTAHRSKRDSAMPQNCLNSRSSPMSIKLR